MSADLGTVIAKTTMKAAAELLHQQGRAKAVDLDRLTVALKREARSALHRILDQGKALLDSGNAGWLESLVAVECTEAAKAAIAGL